MLYLVTIYFDESLLGIKPAYALIPSLLKRSFKHIASFS